TRDRSRGTAYPAECRAPDAAGGGTCRAGDSAGPTPHAPLPADRESSPARCRPGIRTARPAETVRPSAAQTAPAAPSPDRRASAGCPPPLRPRAPPSAAGRCRPDRAGRPAATTAPTTNRPPAPRGESAGPIPPDRARAGWQLLLPAPPYLNYSREPFDCVVPALRRQLRERRHIHQLRQPAPIGRQPAAGRAIALDEARHIAVPQEVSEIHQRRRGDCDLPVDHRRHPPSPVLVPDDQIGPVEVAVREARFVPQAFELVRGRPHELADPLPQVQR